MFGTKNDHFLMLFHEGQLGSLDSELNAVSPRSRRLAILFLHVYLFSKTRSKPPYGRHGLAGSLDTGYSQAGTFLGVLNVLLHTYSAQLGGTQLTFMTQRKKVVIFRPKHTFFVTHGGSN